MEFPFSVNEILPNQITKIRSSLLPEGFVGDRRGSQNCVDKVSEILDEMGKASAKAQGLQRAVTSGEKMRNVDYTVYIFVDPEGNNGKGTVIGLLKVGRKKLFVFDASGAHKEVEPLCILDFYIHESKQRMGMGKILYEYMLQEESVLPIHLAIDRPSEKFMNFLLKHYGLRNILPQNNNFVVYDGFFENNPDVIHMSGKGHLQDNKSVAGMNATRVIEAAGSANSSPHFGRYAAHKPESTVGKIIQNVFPCGELKRVASDGIDPANLHCGEMACLSGSAPDLQMAPPHNEQHHSQLW
ncbi:alpha-tubulin N-acetyltransferase 1-like isoform X1 [Schistocerca nitens]|uniref:alpha-tubulin N-acetyltransferase 1-like isoform X1 n=2 Tax=Schistocerca nitens TaxID=7011 RepID=UPI0021196FDE|nr:alpha-tubulin N-acetyltransferase 1-like isoform X1 [Schistocerca nitens]